MTEISSREIITLLFFAMVYVGADGQFIKSDSITMNYTAKDATKISLAFITCSNSSGGIHMPCASGLCACCFTRTRTKATCSGSNVTDIPDNLPNNITDLTITETNIRSIDGLNITISGRKLLVSKLYQYRQLRRVFFTQNSDFEHIGSGAFELTGSDNNQLTHISIKGSPKLKSIAYGAFGSISHLEQLHIAGSGLTRPPDWNKFQVNSNTILTEINLSNNKIEHLDASSFFDLNSTIGTLNLENNGIKSIADRSFTDVYISEIKLGRNPELKEIGRLAFFRTNILEKLDLSNSNIRDLPTSGLENVEILNLKNVRSLTKFPSVLELQNIKEAKLTYQHHCCAFAHPDQQDIQAWELFVAKHEKACEHDDFVSSTLPIPAVTPLGFENGNTLWTSLSDRFNFDSIFTNPISANATIRRKRYSQLNTLLYSHGDSLDYNYYFDEGSWIHNETLDPYTDHRIEIKCGEFVPLQNVKCTPEPNAFNPCEDMMGTWYLRIAVWIFLTLSIGGNSSVLLVMTCRRQKLSVQNCLMCNLAFADLLLGIYLLMLASADASTIGSYFTHAISWQYQGGCEVAGFLAILATNLSVFTLMVITIERWYAIRHAINLSKRIKMRSTLLIVCVIWAYSLILAILPLFNISSYKITSICLPMKANRILDQVYLIFMLTAEACAFIIICYCYTDMYRQVHGNKNAMGKNDAKIARKMALLIFTDFLCMFPIALFGLTAALGKPLITLSQSKNLLVFFFPINSWINPILYALITKQFRKDFLGILSKFGFCETRAARYRYVFSSNRLSSYARKSGREEVNNRNKNSSGEKANSVKTQYKPVETKDVDCDATNQTSISKSRDSVPMIALNGINLEEVGDGTAAESL